MSDFINSFGQNYGTWIFYIVLLWSLVWKGVALWKSARANSKVWFIVILILNTVGILEIAYVFFLYKINFDKFFSKLSFLRPKKK